MIFSFILVLRVHGDGLQARIQVVNNYILRVIHVPDTITQHKDFMVINKSPGRHARRRRRAWSWSIGSEDTGLDLYPVHRLDKMTSGLVLLARTPEANRALSMAFAARE